ncbi:MAG: hypothetical protein P4N59_18910 [Negativicutes bacterium]|nr:hypothetical protein [Negativicutes bacterium]
MILIEKIKAYMRQTPTLLTVEQIAQVVLSKHIHATKGKTMLPYYRQLEEKAKREIYQRC